MELLEREQFFNELAAILSDVAGGNGRFVLVTGEAGATHYQTALQYAATLAPEDRAGLLEK